MSHELHQYGSVITDLLDGATKEFAAKIKFKLKQLELHGRNAAVNVRPLGDGIFEIKTKYDKAQHRIGFYYDENKIYLVHQWIKKSGKCPSDISLIKDRRKKILSGQLNAHLYQSP